MSFYLTCTQFLSIWLWFCCFVFSKVFSFSSCKYSVFPSEFPRHSASKKYTVLSWLKNTQEISIERTSTWQRESMKSTWLTSHSTEKAWMLPLRPGKMRIHTHATLLQHYTQSSKQGNSQERKGVQPEQGYFTFPYSGWTPFLSWLLPCLELWV